MPGDFSLCMLAERMRLVKYGHAGHSSQKSTRATRMTHGSDAIVIAGTKAWQKAYISLPPPLFFSVLARLEPDNFVSTLHTGTIRLGTHNMR